MKIKKLDEIFDVEIGMLLEIILLLGLIGFMIWGFWVTGR